jgi:hypothetical protein
MKNFLLVGISLIIINCSGAKVADFYQSFPTEINGWEAKTGDKVYGRENLYDYVDGGAELYLTYDFKQVFARKYMKPQSRDIILDVYEMGNDAFGLFSIEREDDDIGIGEDSEYGGGLLRFWKGRYFVSIISSAKDKNSQTAALELAKIIANKIDERIPRPEIIARIPESDLVKKSIKYFHSFEILNRQYFLSDENILQLNRQTDCLIAKYKNKINSGILLVVKYSSEDNSKNAKSNFIKYYIPEAQTSESMKMENGKWVIIKQVKNYLAIALDCSDKDWANNLLNLINFN